MQENRRPNSERSKETTDALLKAARDLFVERGFTGTSTPAIVDRAKVSRGALYHHFADKKDVFRAVLEREAYEVALAIKACEVTSEGKDSLQLLLDGADAYLDSMGEDGRTRLLLVEGPAVLGQTTMNEIEAKYSVNSLREGLLALNARALATGRSLDLDAAVDLLSAAFDRAALEIASGKSSRPYRRVIRILLQSFEMGDMPPAS